MAERRYYKEYIKKLYADSRLVRELLLESQIVVVFFLIIKTPKYVIKTGFSVIELVQKFNFDPRHMYSRIM